MNAFRVLILFFFFWGLSYSGSELGDCVQIIDLSDENFHCYNPKWSPRSNLLAFNVKSVKKENIFIVKIGENSRKLRLRDSENKRPLTHFFWRRDLSNGYIANFLDHNQEIFPWSRNIHRETYFSENIYIKDELNFFSTSDQESMNKKYKSLYELPDNKKYRRYFIWGKNYIWNLMGLRFHSKSREIFVFNNVPSSKSNSGPNLFRISGLDNLSTNSVDVIPLYRSFYPPNLENMQSYILRIHPDNIQKALLTCHHGLDFSLYLIDGFADDNMKYTKLAVTGPVIYDAIWIDDSRIAYLSGDSIISQNFDSTRIVEQVKLTLKIFNMNTQEEYGVNDVSAKMHPFWHALLYDEVPSIYYSKYEDAIFFIGGYGANYAIYKHNLTTRETTLINNDLVLPDYINISPDHRYAAVVAKAYTTDSKYYSPQQDQYYYKIFIFELR